MTQQAITGIKAIVNTLLTLARGIEVPGTNFTVLDTIYFLLFIAIFSRLIKALLGLGAMR